MNGVPATPSAGNSRLNHAHSAMQVHVGVIVGPSVGVGVLVGVGAMVAAGEDQPRTAGDEEPLPPLPHRPGDVAFFCQLDAMGGEQLYAWNQTKA